MKSLKKLLDEQKINNPNNDDYTNLMNAVVGQKYSWKQLSTWLPKLIDIESVGDYYEKPWVRYDMINTLHLFTHLD